MRKINGAVILVTIIVSIQSAHAYNYSDYSWSSYDGKEYALTLDLGNWLEMEAEAEAVGGTLVNINDEPEDTWLFNTYLTELLQYDYIWIGFYQDHNDPGYSEPAGGWKWICGDPVAYVGWDPPEPTNHAPGEDYGTLTGAAHWNDWGPDRQDYYPIPGIIEIPEPCMLSLLAVGGLLLRRKHRG